MDNDSRWKIRSTIKNPFVLAGLSLAIIMLFAFGVNAVSPSNLGANLTSRVTTKQPVKEQTYKVTKVIDGDTIEVSMNGKTEKIRLIGIDTPEVVDPKTPAQCYGSEASKKAKEKLLNNFVTLESDSTQGDRDKYKRLLRYVFLKDKTNFGKYMISEGYAKEYTYDKAYKYQKEYKAAETVAKKQKKGLWGTACQTNTTTPTTKTSPSKNIFSCNVPKTCTQMTSCAEAKFYLNTCGKTKLDADKDGVPCESICN